MLNYDNEETKSIVELCYRTTKTLVNPIIDWEEDDVWEFLNGIGVEHCCLYDEGVHRIGCIGCPLSRHGTKDFERWPKYRTLYLKTFDKMLAERKHDGLETKWKSREEVMEWWLRQ